MKRLEAVNADLIVVPASSQVFMQFWPFHLYRGRPVLPAFDILYVFWRFCAINNHSWIICSVFVEMLSFEVPTFPPIKLLVQYFAHYRPFAV